MHNSAKVVPLKPKPNMDARDRAKLARLPAPVHNVQEKGKQCLQKALRAVFDNADDALFALADKATSNHDQNLFFESMREVRISRRRMESEFADAIDNGFASLVSDKPHSSSHEYDSYGMSSSELSLVEDEDLEELVAIDAMVAKATNTFGESLQYLSLRLDSLVPQKVYHKNNPLGPDAVCHAFVEAAKSLDADIKAKLVLFKLFDQYVVNDLGEVYRTLNDTLIEQGVLPSLNPSQLAKTNGGGANTGANSGAQGAPVPPGATQATAGQQPGASGNGAAVAGGSPVQGQELLGVLSAIQASQTNGSDASIPAPAEVQALVAHNVQSQYGQRQVGNAELDIINLVKMLFEFILDDNSLAEPMKVLIGRLQIPILKVALLDSSFFSKSGHPARRLLNEMATACLGWQADPDSNGPPNDPLYSKINETVHLLLNEFENDVTLFNDVLADFVSFVERERKRASILEKRTIDAEAGKAKAEAARATVNELLEKKIDGRPVPDAVQVILDEAWSNLLFLICLRQGTDNPDWESALGTADDLIWSVTTPINQESRQKLLALLPDLLKRIRAGMEQISYNPFELTKLLNQLQKLHLERLQQPKEQQAQAPAPANDEVQQSATPEADESSTEEEREAAATVEPDVDDAPAESAAETQADNLEDTDTSAADIDQSYLQLVNKLTMGTWFEISENGAAPYRCRLAAIIKATGKYIFVNRSGMKVAEKSRDSLAMAMKDGSLRLLDDTMLFDRALESVIGGSRKSRAR